MSSGLALEKMNGHELSPPDRNRPVHLGAVEKHNRSLVFFVTVCTSERRPLLANDAAHGILLAAWRDARSFVVGRYVIMPDHVHLFCAPAVSPPESLAKWVAYWKSISARNSTSPHGHKLWQRDFWDRQLRSGDSYSEKWDYVRNNPVRAGLVKNPDEWKWQGELEGLRWHS